jgi:hypothetical protein
MLVSHPSGSTTTLVRQNRSDSAIEADLAGPAADFETVFDSKIKWDDGHNQLWEERL